MDFKKLADQVQLSKEIIELFEECKSIQFFNTSNELAVASMGGQKDEFVVGYDVPGKGFVEEAIIHKVNNGISANYVDPYMRRRDPNTMAIGDDKPTDKSRFADKYGYEFETLRKETFDWLKKQDLAAFLYHAGSNDVGVGGIAIAPANAGFFALGLSMLQKIISLDNIPENFKAEASIFVAPPFRHTHFEGKQVVVHNRLDHAYEMFSYNLYPGPSAKKGLYGALLTKGEEENWVTAHCSSVQTKSPYDNITTFMHEGASGGGKSEMHQHIIREPNGQILLGTNLETGVQRKLSIPLTSDIFPVCDDMAVCHPSLQKGNKKLWIQDAENAWFIRTDSVNQYGDDPFLERTTINAKSPLLFLNIDTNPGGLALIWEHIEDEPGKKCPNPRVVVPRKDIPNVIDDAVSIDIRSFGVRTPPCSAENPSYGIVGLFHILPPALAWLWRLVSPRGFANPSIVGTDKMSSEGVGSYWPFATGKKVHHANLLLDQILETPRVRYTLAPNQHIGVWKVGFKPQLLMREYLTRRGNAKFKEEQLSDALCPLLGYELNYLSIEGSKIPIRFLKTYHQPEVGEEGYKKGAQELQEFFESELQKFLTPDLSDTGKKIIDICLNKGSNEDYLKLIPML